MPDDTARFRLNLLVNQEVARLLEQLIATLRQRQAHACTRAQVLDPAASPESIVPPDQVALIAQDLACAQVLHHLEQLLAGTAVSATAAPAQILGAAVAVEETIAEIQRSYPEASRSEVERIIHDWDEGTSPPHSPVLPVEITTAIVMVYQRHLQQATSLEVSPELLNKLKDLIDTGEKASLEQPKAKRIPTRKKRRNGG